MEEALAPSPVAPPPAPLAAAAVLTRRRSHLDSASYRTLSRLFSHCLHLHLHPSQREGTAPPEAEHAATNPTGGDSGDSPQVVPRGADFYRLKDVEKEAADAGGPSFHVTVSPAREQPAAANPTGDPCKAQAPQCSLEDVDEVVAVESACGNTRAGGEELGIGAGLVVVEKDALKLVKVCLETTEVDELVEGAVGNDDGQLLLDAMMTNFTGLIDDVGDGVIPAQTCVVSGGELQNSKASEGSKQSGGGIEDGEPVGNLNRELNDDGFEEGEIEGEFQDLDSEESGDSELGDDDAEDEKLGGDSVSRGSGANESCDHGIRFGNLHSAPEIVGNGHLILNKHPNVRGDAQISVTRAQAVSYDEVVDWNEMPLPDNEAPNPGKKRKHPVTEERKAKKKKNSRMKRAQKRIADGVKRPKLEPVIKPKKPCHFYDHGKCQQGNKCKFSHDFTPSTKSMPCKHFACGSCLKGDDCPYDHELSKYECHNYKNNGMCIRGDRCKFSHVTRTTEGTPTQDAKTSDASLAYEKTKLREHTSIQKTSTVRNGEPMTSSPTKQQCSILKNLAGFLINSQNVSNRIPKGVQFLPFSKNGSNLSSPHPDALSIEKHRKANGTQHQYLGGHEAERQKIVKQNGQESRLHENNSSNEATMYPCSDPKKASLPINSTATSVHTQHEVSEASRILQEFLFGAGS